MAYTFTPLYTYNFAGFNKNPLPSPWASAPSTLDAGNLQQVSNACEGTQVSETNGVSAMYYTKPNSGAPWELIASPCYSQVTIKSLVNYVETESSIDLLLRSDQINITHGFGTEISRNANGGYHFDCISYADGQLVFSEDFGTTAPKAGDIVQVTSVGTTQAVFLNGTLMVSGTSTENPGGFSGTTWLEINNGVTLSDPTVSQFVVGSVAGSI